MNSPIDPHDIDIRSSGPIVPASNVSGRSLTLVIAIMSFLACLTMGAVTMIQDTAAHWQSQIAREITIQIKPSPDIDMEAALATAREVALSFEGTTSGAVLPIDDAAKLLEPWLGTGLDTGDLPIPRLVIVEIDESAPPDFEALRLALAKAVPDAFLDDHRTWVDRLVAMAQTTALIGIAVLVLVCSATVMTVIFATRGALAGNRHIVEVLHFVGAETRFVAKEFQLHFLWIGFRGAFAGGLIAALVFAAASFWQSLTAATPQGDQATALFGRFSLGATGYVGLVAIVAIIAFLTALTTRATVTRTIHQIDDARADPSMVEED